MKTKFCLSARWLTYVGHVSRRGRLPACHRQRCSGDAFRGIGRVDPDGGIVCGINAGFDRDRLDRCLHGCNARWGGGSGTFELFGRC